jgi:hypothetical protein
MQLEKWGRQGATSLVAMVHAASGIPCLYAMA